MKVCVIKVEPHPGNEAGLVRIDSCDYDPNKHVLAYIEGEEPVTPAVVATEPSVVVPTDPSVVDPTQPDGDPAAGVDAGEGGELPATEGQDTSAPSPKTGKKKKG